MILRRIVIDKVERALVPPRCGERLIIGDRLSEEESVRWVAAGRRVAEERKLERCPAFAALQCEQRDRPSTPHAVERAEPPNLADRIVRSAAPPSESADRVHEQPEHAERQRKAASVFGAVKSGDRSIADLDGEWRSMPRRKCRLVELHAPSTERKGFDRAVRKDEQAGSAAWRRKATS